MAIVDNQHTHTYTSQEKPESMIQCQRECHQSFRVSPIRIDVTHFQRLAARCRSCRFCVYLMKWHCTRNKSLFNTDLNAMWMGCGDTRCARTAYTNIFPSARQLCSHRESSRENDSQLFLLRSSSSFYCFNCNSIFPVHYFHFLLFICFRPDFALSLVLSFCLSACSGWCDVSEWIRMCNLLVEKGEHSHALTIKRDTYVFDRADETKT